MKKQKLIKVFEKARDAHVTLGTRAMYNNITNSYCSIGYLAHELGYSEAGIRLMMYGDSYHFNELQDKLQETYGLSHLDTARIIDYNDSFAQNWDDIISFIKRKK